MEYLQSELNKAKQNLAEAKRLDEETGSDGSSSVNKISNSTNGVKVMSTDVKDSIHNNASNVLIYGYMDNDIIRIDCTTNNANVNVLIFGGDGNDVIQNYEADKSAIYGGGGNDFLRSGAENSVIEYTSGDGNDTVVGYGATSTLKIGDGYGTYSTQQSGSNIIVTVSEGKITLSGASCK